MFTLPNNFQIPEHFRLRQQEEEEAQRREELLQQERRLIYEQNRRRMQEIENSDRLFLEDSGRVLFGEGLRVTSLALYEAYCQWCSEQNLPPKGQRDLCCFLIQNSSHYNIKSSTNIPVGNRIRRRGFIGMALCPPPDDTDTL